MSALDQILAAAQQAGVKLWVEGGELRFRAPKGALAPELRAALTSRKAELLAFLAEGDGRAIPRLPDSDDYPLSSAQRRLWVLAQMDASSSAYNIPLALLLVGALDRAALASAIEAVARRHESLRTVFVAVAGEPRQRVLAGAGAALAERDLSSRPDPEETARVWLRAEAAKPFDLERGSLLRVTLLRLASDRYILATTLHHIVADGTSLAVLVREVAQAYEAARRGVPPAWKPLPVQYRDYAVWQQARLASPAMEAHRAYWLEKLADVPPALELPTDRPRPAAQTFHGRIHAFRLGPATLQGLHALARRERASLFMVLVALVKVLLRRHTGQEDIAVASPIAGRDHADLEGQIGFYLNTLVLRDRVRGAASFLEVLRAVRGTALEAYDHQAYPFDQLVNELGLPRDLSRAPLCDVVVMLQNTGDLHLALAGVAARAFPVDAGVSKFDLTFDFQEGPEGLEAGLEYNTDLFDGGRIERLAAHFAVLAAGALADPEQPIGRLPVLTEEEGRQLAQDFNATATPVPAGATVVTLFEAQAARTPAATAVAAEAGALTYAALNVRANRLARYLRTRGAGAGTCVAVCLERSPDLVVALLAVLKAGAAYVPLDPAFPPDRLAFMLEDSGAAVLITDGSAAIPESAARAVVGPYAADGFGENPPAAAGPDDAAYVIYTSGSTGRPKGVEVRHAGLANFLLSLRECPGLTAADTLLTVTTISFDIAGLELWLPLIVGARVALAGRATAADGAVLRDFLGSSGATVLQATPATWRLLLAAGWEGTPGLRMLCGGEALPGELAAQLLPRGAELWNLYGPTETTIWSTLHRVTPADAAAGPVTIGRPIANTQCHVLDAAGQPAPIGVPGELVIGGAGVARGYWRRPELTAEKFIPDPWAADPAGRLYRTGDVARWRADGTLEFLGRADHQVKLRGYRIELGEIEAALAAHPDVRAAAVVLREDVPGDPRLAAYLVPREPGAAAEPAALRAFLRERLPEYMVPTAWRTLAALPLTANGKLNRRALPAPEAEERPGGADYVAPRTPEEAAVAAVWAEVLGVPRVGVNDNFFDLGGHSLKATMAVARLRAKAGGGFTLADLFRSPTVAGFAPRLRGQAAEIAAAAGEGNFRSLTPFPLSAAQRRLWIIDRMRPGLAAYNLPEALRLDGALDPAALRGALRDLVERHETLRTTFSTVDGEPRQNVGPPESPAVREIDVSAAADPEASARAAAAAEAEAPFDLERGPLFRTTLVRLAPERHLLLCTLHHIVGDAWSIGVLRRELAALYGARAEGRPNPLAPLAAGYGDFAQWQQGEIDGPDGARHRDYWLGRLGGERAVLALPTDFPRPAVQTASGRTHVFVLGPELSAALTRLGRAQDATPFMTLLAVLKALLARTTGQDDIVVGSPVAGRDRVEWEGLIGFFVNTLPLRDTVERTESFRGLLERVRDTCRAAFEHQIYPFDRLVDDLKPERDLSRNPLFDVALQLQEVEERAGGLAGLRAEACDQGQPPAKCDLSFDFSRTPDGFACALTYNADLFTAARIERLAGHWLRLARSAVAHPARPIGRLEWMSEAERRLVLEEFNPPRRPDRPERSITGVFAERAARRPDDAALRLDGIAWSYAVLDRRANRLAQVLRRRGVSREARVAVLLERGLETPMVILAVLKAGGVYLPLDPLHPAERLRHMVEDSRPALILTRAALRARCPVGATAVTLEEMGAEIAAAPAEPPQPAPVPAQAAYLIYTSGSTGAPKGVVVEHRGLVNTMADQVARLELTPADRVLQFANCSFDASVFETFLALLGGATLVPAPKAAQSDAREFLDFLRAEGVTVAVLPPSFVRSLDRAPLPLRILYTAGEAAWPQDVEHYRRLLTYVNGYGPTEASICSTAQVVPAAAPLPASVPIGVPLEGTQVRILDADLQPVPVGVAGEICVGGAGVARGYWRRPGLTAERFVPDPFSPEPGARLYRTGDLGRWGEEGRVEFLGRADAQVKLRGFRIELGEIETALAAHPDVREAVVLRREDRPGAPLLVAYVIMKRMAAGAVRPDLGLHLAAKLPEYMIPGAFVELEAFPVTTAGKVDRRALPAPDLAGAEGFAPPRGEAEAAIAGIFRDVLGLGAVGMRDNFFHRGGNSLLAIQALGRLRDLGRGELTVLQFFSQPTVAGLASLLAGSDASAPRAIMPRAEDRPAELSFAQQRLWFLQQLDPASPAYNISVALRLEGALDVARLEAALGALVRRHETLRTSFPTEEGKAAVRIAPALSLCVAQEDLSALPAEEREREARRRVDAETARPFDLAEAPLLRLLILRAAPAEHTAVLVMHHIISDAWSMDVFVRELTRLYAAAADLPPLRLQYADFAAWQRSAAQGEAMDRQLAYWRHRLADPPALALPTDRPRPARPSLAGATLTFSLPAEIASGVRRLAREEEATVFMVLLAAFQALLHRYSGQDDIAVGVPAANRTRSELEPLIGFFVNTLVLRADFTARSDFRSLLRQVRLTALEAFAHQDLPFEKLVQELQPERHLSHNPLFQAMFSLQPAARETLRLPGLALTALPVGGGSAKFDLTLALEETDGEICGALEYRTELFDAGTMRRFGAHYAELLRAAVADAGVRVGELSLLEPAERERVTDGWNQTQREYGTMGLAGHFAERVAARPGAVAVKFGAQELTYAELDARSSRLAHHLRKHGVGPDTLVPVCLERSLDLIVALLGIVKAGGAYVALDPEYPPARLALMLGDVAGPVLLTQEKFIGRLPAGAARLIAVDRDGPEIARESDAGPPSAASLETLAYVSYTSGSTGRPKGVAVPQRGVVRLVKNSDFADLGPEETFLQLAPVAFDASTLEIWGPLLNGGKLVVAPPGTPTLEELGRILREEKITTLWLTAGLFHLMADERLDDLRGLRQLLAGGDVLSVPQVRKVLAEIPGLRLINGYGPTENTTFTCCHTVREADLASGSVPIGKPVANTRVYIVDERLGPVPIGVPGELLTGGDGLARGYLGNPELTAEKFVVDPFSRNREERLYRTGDRARWREDGTIEFLGRLDQQVKIRGYRIEPGEVEAALLAEPGVKSAAVVVRDAGGRKRLVGYATGEGTGEGLRQKLQARLPDYLVPSAIIVLETLPLTAHGKIDRAALPEPDFGAGEDAGFTAPRDDAESEIAAIWCAVLGLARVGIHDNYFSVGGDSIGAIQVASRLKRAGWKVDVRDLFQYPTIADLARLLQGAGRRRPAEAAQPRSDAFGPLPLTPAQAWFFERHRDDRDHFNQAILLRARERLEIAAVAAVVGKLWEHHDALRTVFAPDAGKASARIAAAAAGPGFESVDLTSAPDPESARLAHTEKAQGGFDLATGPLFRAVLYRLPEGDRLLLLAHHAVVDGVSWRILLEDLELGLRQLGRGEPIDFGPGTGPVRRWTEAAALAAEDDAEAGWWNGQAALAAAPWPAAPADEGHCFGDARTIEASLGEAATRTLLTAAHQAYHTEVNDLLLTALGRAIGRRQGDGAVRLTLEGHGRDDLGAGLALDRTVGWFTSLFPVVLPLAGDDLGGHIRQVKEALRALPRKGLGFGLLAFLRPPEKRPPAARAPWPRVSFNYLGQWGEESGGLFAFADESSGRPIGPRVARQHEIDVGAMVVRGRLGLSVTFHPGRLEPAEAEELLADFRRELEAVIAFGAGRALAEKTPADFTSRVFTLPAYDAFLRAQGWSAPAVEDVCRLSPMQAGLLFQAAFDADSSAYFIQMAYRIRGQLAPEIFARAWTELARRHAILRTSFVHEGQTTPVQVVWRERAPEIAVTDLRGRTPAVQRREIAACRGQDLARGFDLAQGPLVRIALFQLEDERFQVVWSYPHVLIDGWSLGVVHRDLLQLYAALAAGKTPSLPAPIPYRDYIRWLEGRDAAPSRSFWTGYLGDYERTASLPRLLPPPEEAAYDYAEHILDLGPELSAQLREAAARAGVTLATFVQTAWGVVLARYNRTDDVVFGGIVSGRPADLPGVEDMVGLFICAVPVRVRPRAGLAFAELAREVQAGALEAESHHHLPTAEIQSLTPLGAALFDHVVIIENYPVDRELARPGQPGGAGWAIEDVEAHDRTHYDFDLTVVPGDTLVLKFEHNRRVHPDDQIARIAEHLRTVFVQVASPAQPAVGGLALLPAAEERRVLVEFNATDAALPAAVTLVDLLEEQSAGAPGRTAIIAGEQRLTYGELHRRANQLAHHLRRLGVGPETAVGLCVDRSPDMVAGVLGIWKAGGAYVPLDPLYPPERLAFMLEDSGVRVLVTQSALADRFEGAGMRVLRLDADALAISGEGDSPPASGLQPVSLAYILYTSGSTGRPKGVMVEHRSLVNAAIGWRRAYGERVLRQPALQMASLSFDVFAGDLIRALTNGGCLVICDGDERLDPGALCDLLARHRVALLESTPGLILPLLGHARAQRTDLGALRLLILGSDTLPAADYRRLVADFGADCRIVNSYGVTEATIDSCFHEDGAARAGAGPSAPIGRPLANTRLYVLDERSAAAPIGVAGELYIGGEGLARGYRNRPELTAERFIEVEVAGRRQRLYRTGDLARWLPDGNLEFLGRGDGQVKVRGFRVELGEVEARLRAHPAVREVAVLVRPVGADSELVAYLVCEGTWDPAALRRHVLAALPEPMTPSHWVRLEKMPLSPNGKVDRRALPASGEGTASRRSAFAAPRGAAEETLARIWREVLQVERIGVHDNFFELGGHSLKAMQVVSRIQQELGVKPALRAFFQQPTIAALAGQLGSARVEAMAAVPPAPAQEHYELSYAQQRLWLAHRLGGASAYNMPEAYRLDAEIDAEALEQAFRLLVARHEALRTAFVEVGGEPRQRILPAVDFSLTRLDLSGEPRAEELAREIADREAVAPFDLAHPPLLRATLITLGPQRAVFLFTMHHIVGDGWSGKVLYQEVFALYAAARRGLPDPLPPLRIHYKDFAVWQKARGFEADERYWLQRLAGVPATLPLPYDFTPGEERDFRGDSVTGEIDQETVAALRRLALDRKTTLANVVLAVFKLLLFQLTKREDLCLGVSVANRSHPDLESLIGFFVNILPIRVRLDEAMEFDALLAGVVAACEEAFEHQDYPFDLLVQKLNPARAANRQPLLNVVYAFQNFADVHVPAPGGGDRAGEAEAGAAQVRAFEHAFKTSKFDLTLFVSDEGGKLELTLEYDTGLFRAETAARYLALLERFARAVADRPAQV